MAGGRPSKLTAESQKRITDAIRVGATYELAAQYGGVAYNTFNEWMKAGAGVVGVVLLIMVGTARDG